MNRLTGQLLWCIICPNLVHIIGPKEVFLIGRDDLHHFVFVFRLQNSRDACQLMALSFHDSDRLTSVLNRRISSKRITLAVTGISSGDGAHLIKRFSNTHQDLVHGSTMRVFMSSHPLWLSRLQITNMLMNRTIKG